MSRWNAAERQGNVVHMLWLFVCGYSLYFHKSYNTGYWTFMDILSMYTFELGLGEY